LAMGESMAIMCVKRFAVAYFWFYIIESSQC
jgi:hypothetical protein